MSFNFLSTFTEQRLLKVKKATLSTNGAKVLIAFLYNDMILLKFNQILKFIHHLQVFLSIQLLLLFN